MIFMNPMAAADSVRPRLVRPISPANENENLLLVSIWPVQACGSALSRQAPLRSGPQRNAVAGDLVVIAEAAHALLRAGLALNPTFSIARYRASPSSDHPRHLAGLARILDALRKAGVPEG